jgi:dTDP-4-dehydrorhamnose 3,5-epimerase
MANINKIQFFKKKIITHPKGNIMHYIKKNDKNYLKFGEVYFTWIKKNALKAWKFHKKMHMNLTVPVGSVKFTFFDDKFKKKFIFNLSEKNFGTLYVPPKIWFSFKNTNQEKDSLVVNFSNIIHDKSESINKDFKEMQKQLK